MARPGLDRALAGLRRGDVLMVWKLDRLGRTIRGVIELVDELRDQGVEFRSLTEGFDTTNHTGRLLFHIVSALAEVEKDLIRERTRAGLAAANARGRKGGRKRRLDERAVKMARAMLADQNVSVGEVAQTLVGMPCAVEAKEQHIRIVIETIPHSRQAYDTVGDWRWRKPSGKRGPAELHITVSEMSDWRYEVGVAVHELVEARACKHAGVSEQTVTAWDTGPGKDLDEPGDAPAAPHEQHVFAEKIERQVMDQLGVDWARYSAELASK
jgi:hypothetical protein